MDYFIIIFIMKCLYNRFFFYHEKYFSIVFAYIGIPYSEYSNLILLELTITMNYPVFQLYCSYIYYDYNNHSTILNAVSHQS